MPTKPEDCAQTSTVAPFTLTLTESSRADVWCKAWTNHCRRNGVKVSSVESRVNSLLALMEALTREEPTLAEELGYQTSMKLRLDNLYLPSDEKWWRDTK